jgi:hypothetical protein
VAAHVDAAPQSGVVARGAAPGAAHPPGAHAVPGVAEVHGADGAAVEQVVLAAGGKTPRRGRAPRPASTPHSCQADRRHLP